MKKILFLVLASQFFGINYAQCPVTDVILETQAEINAFPTTYPGCSNLTVNLSIGKSDFTTSDIADLSPLSGLTSIGGYLYIHDNLNLSNLNGLSGLTNVATGIYIDDNDGLTDLAGLTGLSTVGYVDVRNNDVMTSTVGMTNLTSMSGYFSAYNNPELLNFAGMSTISSITDFYVGSNPKLLDFNGFDSLTTITGFAQIENNAGLVNFNGLDNLMSISGNTYLFNNNALVDFTGLNNLETINGYLRVVGNQILTNLNGFDSLVSVGSYFEVKDNPAMISLDGIETLTTLNGNIQIEGGMPNLVDISGIGNIDYTSIARLFIRNNTSLAVCEELSICEFLDNGGIRTISGNATGCASPSEVTAACVPVLGIDDFSSEKEISFYPNPVKDKLFFNIPTNVEIEKVELYSLDGKLLKKYILNSSEIDLQSFESGIYILKITSSKTVFARKIIKT